MKKLIRFIGFIVVGLSLFQSCKNEESVYNGPAKTMMWYSVDDAKKQVAFTALTQQVDSWTWDFGDGSTGTEKNPVHVYKLGGIYTVKLTARGAAVDTTVVATIPIALTDFVKLTGGGNYPNGKTWKLDKAAVDTIAYADADFTTASALTDPFVAFGGFGQFAGLAEIFDDSFTFKADGSYIHASPHNPPGAFTGLVNSIVTTGGANILNVTANSQAFGMCYTSYTPQAGATFTFTEKEDVSIPTVDFFSGVVTNRTYKGVRTLDFSGTEFVGLRDFTRKCIIRKLTPNSMTLALFFSATQGADFAKPCFVLKLTFVAQ